MSLILIRKALEERLALITPAISTAYENVSFTPVNNVPYQRVNLLTAAPANPTLGGSHYREEGIFQVTLCYPENQAVATINARVALVRNQFVRGLSLTTGGVSLTIARTPAVLTAFIDEARYCLAISIEWFSSLN